MNKYNNTMQHGSRRVARNTILLYIRQIVILLVNLYAVRVVLKVLGTEDYGIYNVVAGVVTMFSFLSSAMATASQRYFSIDLGKGDYEHLKVTFSVTLQIYLLLTLVIYAASETIGVWFINSKLVIPSERMFAANFIYQAAILSFAFTLISTPWIASIIAHENMSIYAYISIIEATLKLSIVFILVALPYDKLIVYGILQAIVALINSSIYFSYCFVRYKECRVRFLYDKPLFRELIAFSFWNLIGSSVGVVKNQITSILLNFWFGPVINAARGIAMQVSNAVASFAQNFTTAMRPQVIKSYSRGKIEDTFKAVFWGCKFTFFLMYVFSMPLILEMKYVLGIWLGAPPEETILFTQLVLIDVLIDSLGYQIMTLAQATGKIKMYQIVVGGILILNWPISYIVLKLGFPAHTVFIVSIILTVIAEVARLIIVQKIANFPVKQFIIRVIIPCAIGAMLSLMVPLVIYESMESNFIRLCLIIVSSIVATGICSLYIGLDKHERHSLLVILKSKICKKNSKSKTTFDKI